MGEVAAAGNGNQPSRELHAFWLFVLDVAVLLGMGKLRAEEYAKLVWPDAAEKEVYKDKAKALKQEVSSFGPIPAVAPNLLWDVTRDRLLSHYQERSQAMARHQNEGGGAGQRAVDWRRK